MITLACPSCAKQLKVKDELAGKKGKCPGCGKSLTVPEVAETPRDETLPGGKASAQLPASSVPASWEQFAPPESNDDTMLGQSGERPAQAAQAAQGSGVPSLPPVVPRKQPAGKSPPVDIPGPSATGERVERGSASYAPPPMVSLLAPAESPGEIGRLGPYRVLALLGKGGMGMVFKALDPHLDRLVALKAMLPAMAGIPEAKQRFFREAKAAAALKHPHIVTIFQVGEDRGFPFLAMEFLEGESLEDRILREGRLPLAEVLRIGRETAEGLAAAHERGVIHRDIKPANLWLDGKVGHVKILDFGLARSLVDEQHLTQSGAILGTPAYMAPEQADGKTVDARADLFSLGCVLYRLCVGELPFKGDTTMAILRSLALEDPMPLSKLRPEVPQPVSGLVLSLLAKNPKDRPTAATEVIDSLRQLELSSKSPRQSTRKTPQAPCSPAKTARRPIRRGLAWLVLGAVFLAGLVGLGLWASGLIRVQTPQGDLVLECDDPDFAFSVAKGGGITLEDRKAKRKYNIKAVRHGKDEYELEVADPAAELTFKTRTFTVKRGEKVALSAWFERKREVVPAVPPVPSAMITYLDDVAETFWYGNGRLGKHGNDMRGPFKWKGRQPPHALYMHPTPEKLASAVEYDLSGRYQSFLAHASLQLKPVGKVTFRVKGDGKTLWELAEQESPEVETEVAVSVRGVKTLRLEVSGAFSYAAGIWLDARVTATRAAPGEEAWFGRVAALSPDEQVKAVFTKLKECNPGFEGELRSPRNEVVTELSVLRASKLVNLAPLRALPGLSNLLIRDSDIVDLSPLQGMHLTHLNLGGTQVVDLTPLRGMPLVDLSLWRTPIANLKPLEGMPLTRLLIQETKVTDLKPLKAMPLTYLDIQGCPVGDLSPLKGAKLNTLFCRDCEVADLSPLSGLPLRRLDWNEGPKRDAGLVRSFSDLETINGQLARGVALVFPFGNARGSIPSLKTNAADAMTLEAWVMHTSHNEGRILGTENFGIGFRAGPPTVHFQNKALTIQAGAPEWIYDWRGGTGFYGVPGLQEMPGLRTHLAAVKSADSLQLFVNGKLAAKQNFPGPASLDAAEPFFIGSATMWLQGVRISKSARYKADFTPEKRFRSDADTLALYHCDEGKGNVLTDVSGNKHHAKLEGTQWLRGILE